MKNIEFLVSNGVDIDSSLELFGDIKTYNDTLGEFIVSAREKLNKLANYKSSKDIANYAIYVHSLKSDAKYFGFKDLAQIALEHEEKSKAGDLFYVEDNFAALEDLVNKSINIASSYLSGDEASILDEKNKVENTNISSGEVYTTKAILVVDDSNIITNFVKRIFDQNYNVGMAKNGQEAIEIINSNKDNENISAILLDLNMPGVDGFAVLDFMEKNNLLNKMPVSIISGDSSKETIDKAFKYPIVDMLGKPFTQDDVKRIVEKTMWCKTIIEV